jgi:hypothetical protein
LILKVGTAGFEPTAPLARKFREEKLIPAVYVGDKKIAGRRELTAPRAWLLQLEYCFGAIKLHSFAVC